MPAAGFDSAPAIDLGVIVSHLLKLAAAFVLALPVAWDRERQKRSLGLRTFPLVAMASTGFVLVGRALFGTNAGELARLIQGLLTGVGFLGGGAIVKQGVTVHGTATAASIWSTAAVGLAVAVDRYEIAIVLTLANFLTLRYLKSVKGMVGEDEDADGQEAGEKSS